MGVCNPPVTDKSRGFWGDAIPPFFVKTGKCSTKHNLPPRPVTDTEDALSHLLSSGNVRDKLANGMAQGILVQPWNPDISPNNEFRVFVRSGIVTGVTQQFLYENYPVMRYWTTEDVITAFQKLWGRLLHEMRPDCVYRDSVFDGYITTDSKGEIEPYLIEINSGNWGWDHPDLPCLNGKPIHHLNPEIQGS